MSGDGGRSGSAGLGYGWRFWGWVFLRVLGGLVWEAGCMEHGGDALQYSYRTEVLIGERGVVACIFVFGVAGVTGHTMSSRPGTYTLSS